MFDLDGTLLRGPTVCEVLAAKLGHVARAKEMERITDLDELRRAREEMAGWYGAVERAALEDMLDGVTLAPGAVDGCRALLDAGVIVAIASITWEFAVARFARLLGATEWLGTRLGDDGSIAHSWAETKADWVNHLRAEHRLLRDEVAAIGDSAGDIPLLDTGGRAVFVGPALVDGLPAGTVHMPGADITDVAALLLRERA